MKTSVVITLISAILGLAVANLVDKQQLCTDVCWTYDVNNHADCQKRCMDSQRPTADEAGQCQSCINDCAAYLSESRNVAIYTECRGGCFAKYFPTFAGGKRAVKAAHKQKEHIPGLPSSIHLRLGGASYPVEDRICEVSCRAKGADNILANGDGAMDTCLKGCKRSPSTREQELQMSLDCNKECANNGKIADGCLEPCIVKHARSRNPAFPIALNNVTAPAATVNDSSANAVPIVDVVPTTSNGTFIAPTAPVVPVAVAPHKASSARTSTKPNKSKSTAKAVEVVAASESATASESEVLSKTSTAVIESATSKSDQKKAERISAAAGQSYFESASFWFHAAGTLTIAMIVGFQLV